MISLRITNNKEDIRQWTGLSNDNHDEALWDAGFNLDDLDMCIESDTRLLQEVIEEDDRRTEPVSEAWWLVNQMDSYCCEYNEIEYNGKWYYTIHHA